ncbi:Repeat domain-containing protein [Geodermatophilus pulveris]|uniref:Repeat domain-containing protein n=1 Tax=Geodermatophilus pulveris TaxID=1564159 RepID=A0A239DK99_9ACTN|nr:M14 family zinc carboxypeptidase [Geodermatophilus pulveris]SNS32880.1 Repeat domain-containing protein [Geodermatophilus pulveris]
MAYLNAVEIESALQNLAAAYPDAAELVPCPHLTHEGRRTHVLRVGTSDATDVDAVLLLGGVHAREWVPPDALVSLAADLLEAFSLGTGLGYGGQKFSSAEIQQIMGTINLLIYPCVNPDGRQHSQTVDALWRKNRRPHLGGGNCIGVDLNRNFDFLWDHLAKFAGDSGVNTSANPCDRFVFRGPHPASEPETRNVVWVLDNHPRIRWLVDVHSAVPVILHSWGSDENQTARPEQTFLAAAFDSVRGRRGDTAYGEYITQADLDVITALSAGVNDAILMVRGDDYGFEQAYGLYPTSGASDDYAFSRHFVDPAKGKVYGFTIECGRVFQPDLTEAEGVIREVSAGLLALGLAVAANAPSSLSSAEKATDIALVRQTPGWATIPVAFATGDGGWRVTNGAAPAFIPDWAHQPGVRLVAGDFNGDGLTDIALVRQTPGWATIPVAFATGDGGWRVTNGAAPAFITDWAHQPGVRLVAGDFNGDGLTDIALVRQTPGWATIPVAFATGDGGWRVTNGAAPAFITDWAHQPDVRLAPGAYT